MAPGPRTSHTRDPSRTRARRLWWAGLALAAAVTAALLFRYGVRDHVFARNFAVVSPGELYRSGRLTPAAMRRVAERYRVRTIIDLGAYHPGSREERLAQRTADALGLTRYRLDLEGDATGNPNEYAHALRLLNDPAHRPALVHCAAGSERTGCLVALYRAQRGGFDPAQRIDQLMAEAQPFRDSRQPDLRGMLVTWGPRILQAVQTGTPVRGIEPTDPPTPVTHPQGRLATDPQFDADSPYKHAVPIPAE
jgi:hypothetical protein